MRDFPVPGLPAPGPGRLVKVNIQGFFHQTCSKGFVSLCGLVDALMTAEGEIAEASIEKVLGSHLATSPRGVELADPGTGKGRIKRGQLP